jgi:hypothetical protein
MSGSPILPRGDGNDRLLLRSASRRHPVDTGPGAVRLAEGLRGLVVGMSCRGCLTHPAQLFFHFIVNNCYFKNVKKIAPIGERGGSSVQIA